MDKTSEEIRHDFPTLDQMVNQAPLAYLDNAATSQRPAPVLKAVEDFYFHDNANVHRGVHTLAQRVTDRYEQARETVRQFLGAESPTEIIFTKGCTEALNLVASSYGMSQIQAGDEIVISIQEHHSNLIPWQQLAIQKGAILKYIDLTDEGEIDLTDAQEKITDQTKLVAINHASNVMGTITPLKTLVELAHQKGAVVVADGAQAVLHESVNVRDLDVDFYAFSGHKMLAPMGIGVLYGKASLLEKMPPYQYGGEMISRVQRQESSWAQAPYKFEAGTQNVAGAIGLAAAIDYLNNLGWEWIQQQESELIQYATQELTKVAGLKLYGPKEAQRRSGVFSFNLGQIHPHDVATALDMAGVAVRAGHHCAQPLMEYLGVPATVRASFAFYNTKAEVDQLVAGLQATKEFFDHGA